MTEELGTKRTKSNLLEANKRLIDETNVIDIEDVERQGLFRRELIENIRGMGITSLFPVQTEIIPHIIRRSQLGGDICVSAPTGSGKTLTYAIPIIHLLSTKSIRRLRALILVPTRDLVSQVYEVFQSLSKGTNLKIVAMYGDKNFKEEQLSIVNYPVEAHTDSKSKLKVEKELLRGGSSLVDVIISTPGRLVEHLQETVGFTLQHLEFLVVDEADRLLMQSYQDWLPKVLDSVYSDKEGQILEQEGRFIIDAVTSRPAPQSLSQFPKFQTSQLVKMLFSATLTKNPQKISSLRLVNPLLFTASSQAHYKIPETVEQNVIVCREDTKPLVVYHLLLQIKESQILCFTSSVESTHRLSLLLKLMSTESAMNEKIKNFQVIEYSSQLTQQERNNIINGFKSGKPGIIICSDIMSRGLDIEDVGVVINYDVPPHIKTYVHRVGRTGRAGKKGISYTLAKSEEMRHFKQSLSKAENSKQNQIKMDFNELKEHEERYKQSLKQLQMELEIEKGTIVGGGNENRYIRIDSGNEKDQNTARELLIGQLRRNWLKFEGGDDN